MNQIRNISAALIAGAVPALAAAQSAGTDIAEAVGKLADVASAVATLGLAVLGIAVGIKLFKWLRAAL